MDTESPVDFAVATDRDERAWVVAPSGEVDMATVEEVRSAITARPPECDVLVLDFAALTFLDTSGLRLVVEAMQETRAHGVRLALVRGSEDVQRLFVLARLESRLPFFDDVSAAVGDC